MRRLLYLCIAGALLPALAPTAIRAHFVWIDLHSSDADSKARVWFSESPKPSEQDLIERIVRARAWRLDDEGRTIELSLAKASDNAELVATLPTSDDRSARSIVVATCDYGVVSRDGEDFLLQYYALRLDRCNSQLAAASAAVTKLAIVPTATESGYELMVLFNGHPVVNAEVICYRSDEQCDPLFTDENGVCRVDWAVDAPFAARARWIETGINGERDGKTYRNVRHYATLIVAAPSEETQSASAILQQARQERAVWRNFPGFTAQATLDADGVQQRGQVSIDADGVVVLDFPESKSRDWAEAQLSSLAQHRMPDGSLHGSASFAETDSHHPLGRAIRLGEPVFGSVYRIRDGVIREVNRQSNGTRFTISVLDVVRNHDQKYLPRIISVATWDCDTERLLSQVAVTHSWTRVGEYDLPSEVVEIHSADGAQFARRMLFSSHTLGVSSSK